MQTPSFTALAVFAALTFGLSGCSSLDNINHTLHKTDTDYTRGNKAMHDASHVPPVSEMSGQWINPVPIAKQNQKSQLPPCAVTFTRPGAVSLNDVLAFISKSCRVPATATADAQSAIAGGGSSETAQVKGNLPLPKVDSGMPSLAGMASTGGGSVSTGKTLHGVYWQGSAAGLLDNVTTRMGLSWRYDHGHVSVFYLDTRHYPILFMDNVTDFSSKVVSGTTSSNGTSGGSSGSSGGLSGDTDTEQTTKTSLKTSLYADLDKSIQSMLTPGVGREFLSAGMLTVTDTPQVLDNIKHYIDDRNSELNRQVVINVEVLSLTKHREDQLGIDWDMVFSSGGVSGSVANAFAGTASDAMTSGLTILNGRFAGSKAFLEALSEQANVSIVTQEASTTTNMSAVPIQVGTQQDYADSVTNEDTANVGSSTSISKSTVTTGFNMTVLPYILPSDGEVQLLASLSMSDDPTFRTFNSGDASIELMKTKMKVFSQRAMLHNGQTLVLSGFQQMNDTGSKQGVGSPSFWGLGGGGDAQNDKTMLVILITPTVME
ncbi:PilN family type IVB pilus formation outer membrane protein [Scandinavium goeteborgense]|uniref:PilN family type IVB pilus formation outer membrane protein n=1 Tax=Scandinavium goeteborgense TaxID=1851514 RepID=UPI0037FFCD48